MYIKINNKRKIFIKGFGVLGLVDGLVRKFLLFNKEKLIWKFRIYICIFNICGWIILFLCLF